MAVCLPLSAYRRLAGRITIECHIGALPCTPFPASRDFAPVGSMSLDFQVASLSYKSSSFATSRGNEKIGALDIVSHMTQTANPVTLLASPLGEEGHKVAKGVQANWIHRGAPRPANPVRRHPAKSVWTVVILIMILYVDVTAERRHYKTHRPLKGKRLTTFCASLALLHPLLSLTHWIFRSLMLPYKSSSHSAKCVRCAPQGDTTTLGLKGRQT